MKTLSTKLHTLGGFYLETPLGLWLTLDSGQFQRVTLDAATNKVEITLAPGDAYTSTAMLRIHQPAKIAGIGAIAPQGEFERVRGANAIPLADKSVVVRLSNQVGQPQ